MKIQWPRQFRRDDGVSSVLGGILFFSLIVTFLIVVRASYVPIWEEDREARAANIVQGQMTSIKSELERQASNRTAESVSMPVTLGSKSASRLFTPAVVPSTLTFDPRTADIHIETDEMLLFEKDGVSLSALDESWTSVPGVAVIQDVAKFKHLRIEITDPYNNDGDFVRLRITQDGGSFGGEMLITVLSDGGTSNGYRVAVEVKGPTSTTIYRGGIHFNGNEQPTRVFIDALTPEYHFVDALGGARKPLDLTITESSLDARYAAVYLFDTGSENILIGDSGLAFTDWAADFQSGTFRFDGRPNYYPGQRFVVENGALILEQDGFTVMQGVPQMDVVVANGVTFLQWTLPNTIGDADTINEIGTTLVSLDSVQVSSVTGASANLIIQFTTDYPEAWEDYLDELFSRAGLDSTVGEYVLGPTPDGVSLTIFGVTADPSSTVRDVQLILKQGSIDIDLRD